MARFSDYDDAPTNMSRQRDFVLNMNEFAHILNKTDGSIKCAVGPYQTSLSQQEVPVIFNTKTKKFDECVDYDRAKQLFVSAPEGWYVVLKNPTADGLHPETGRPNMSPKNIEIGKKVNIFGPASFALFPGQMSRVIQGHRLRSNQYLLARVYDAVAANKNNGVVTDADGKEQKTKVKYFPGQLLVIKGTEVSFYMPPTGIEVIPVNEKEYVRDAVTLERLEYAILKDEDGEKKYAHGPAVVFPEPTQTFINSPKGGVIFRALELSPISGIYVKVIADYKDSDGTEHKTGEELFITGNEQMIYYPRPEHAMIQYDGKYMHHAIAIPEGEGRYILNRLTGEIKTVKGPAMYLPDPRTEVVVKRKLTKKECALYYPGNQEVMAYNLGLNEKVLEKNARNGKTNLTDVINNAYSTSNQESTLAIFEANANISRGVSYTKPRTITLDTKYEGVVSIDVWRGYAVCVGNKAGDRKIVVGPATVLLDYDETLESIEMDGIETVYLNLNDNVIKDRIIGRTSDFTKVSIDIGYTVSFENVKNPKWFNVLDYSIYLKNTIRNIVRREVEKYSIQDFYVDSTDIIRKVILNDENEIRKFADNDMILTDIEIGGVGVENKIALSLEQYRESLLSKNLELENAHKEEETIKNLAAVEKEKADIEQEVKLYKLSLKDAYEKKLAESKAEMDRIKRAEAEAAKKAEVDMQTLIDQIKAAELNRNRAEDAARIETENKLVEIEKAKQASYAETVKKIMESISPDLVAALQSSANANMLEATTKAMSPYAMAKGESIADVTNKLLRGTSLEGVIEKMGTLKAVD